MITEHIQFCKQTRAAFMIIANYSRDIATFVPVKVNIIYNFTRKKISYIIISNKVFDWIYIVKQEVSDATLSRNQLQLFLVLLMNAHTKLSKHK